MKCCCGRQSRRLRASDRNDSSLQCQLQTVSQSESCSGVIARHFDVFCFDFFCCSCCSFSFGYDWYSLRSFNSSDTSDTHSDINGTQWAVRKTQWALSDHLSVRENKQVIGWFVEFPPWSVVSSDYLLRPDLYRFISNEDENEEAEEFYFQTKSPAFCVCVCEVK